MRISLEKVPFLVRKKQLWYNKVPVSGRGIMMNLNFKMIEKYGKDGLFAWKMLHRAFSVGKRLFLGRKRKQKRQGKQRQKKRLVVDVPVFLCRSVDSPTMRRTKRLGRTVLAVKNRYF